MNGATESRNSAPNAAGMAAHPTAAAPAMLQSVRSVAARKLRSVRSTLPRPRSRATAGSSEVAIAVGRNIRISAPLTATAYSPSATSEAIRPTRIWSRRAFRNSETLPGHARAPKRTDSPSRRGLGRLTPPVRSPTPASSAAQTRCAPTHASAAVSTLRLGGREHRRERARVEPAAGGRDRGGLAQPPAADQEVVVDERRGDDPGHQDREVASGRARRAPRRAGRARRRRRSPATSDVASENASRFDRSIARAPGRCAASTLVAWPRPTFATRAVTSAVTVMNATLPRPAGPSERATSSAATRKPAAPTMFDGEEERGALGHRDGLGDSREAVTVTLSVISPRSFSTV